jgi:ATP-dependent Lhr-like helicase
MSGDVFYRLAPFVREYIYRKKWDELHEIQAKAINAVFDEDGHIVISSGTASGKTEAAFFPILSMIGACQSVAILYVSPLKALINDQFARIEELLKAPRIKVWKWHGDVSASKKSVLLKQPSGILQITPESLEAMLMQKRMEISHLFHDLRFVVIDELHAFMGSDRGNQLLCQLQKIERWAKCSPRRIGLSATIGNIGAAAVWLGSGTDKKITIIEEKRTKRRISISVDHHTFSAKQAEVRTGSVEKEAAEEEKKGESFYGEIYKRSRGSKSIIFTNSRSDAEDVIMNLRKIAAAKREPDIFHVHHGSISKVLREEAEYALRESEGSAVTAATLTLELGIDIGKLDRVIQIGAPYTCSSFVQRLGRSGRISGVSEMYFTGREPITDNPSNVFETIPWILLRTIACIQLYVEERFIEPLENKSLPLSLLYQQTLSMLFSMGAMAPAYLAQSVLTLTPFSCISKEDFRLFLLHLIEIGHLQKTEDGSIIIGDKAEPIVNHFTFYSIFDTSNSYKVICGSQDIGELDGMPPIGICILLAGSSWIVTDTDMEKKIIYVKSSKSAKPQIWRGGGGAIHTRIIRKIRDILVSDEIFPYLNHRAAASLASARDIARKAGFIFAAVVPYGNQSLLFFPWVGDVGARTLDRFFKMKKVREALLINATEDVPYSKWHPCFYIIQTSLSFENFEVEYMRLIGDIHSNFDIEIDEKILEKGGKYDMFLLHDLLLKQYISNAIDYRELRDLLW